MAKMLNIMVITGVSGFFKDMTGFLPSLIFSYISIRKRCRFGVNFCVCVCVGPYLMFIRDLDAAAQTQMSQIKLKLVSLFLGHRCFGLLVQLQFFLRPLTASGSYRSFY